MTDLQHSLRITKLGMIPVFQSAGDPELWKTHLKGATRSAEALAGALGLALDDLDLAPDFPVRVPEPYLARIERGNAKDPLLLQILPSLAERLDVEGFADDALGEAEATRAPGLLQKYAGRALLMTTPACAVHCRYCFRRHFPYSEHTPIHHGEALELLERDPSIREVILSGGDPLVADDQALANLFNRLGGLAHIQRIRIHTRLPVVIPQRVTEQLCAILAEPRVDTVMVVHTNHARELDQETATAFNALRQAGVTLLNQSVLLRGINDSLTALEALSATLFEQGVLPYYLHQLDRVRGTAHFEVPDDEAAALVSDLHARLSGYLVPRLVREQPGQSGKTPIYWTTRALNSL